ncbi:hypothetical protein ES708_30086 [subsurface metagenome]
MKVNFNKSLVIILLLILAFFSGCSGVVTPDTNGVGGDFYICENLLKGFYTALSNQNFAQALSYCKSGGATFKLVNNLWDLSQEYPTFYVTYQVYDVYDFSYLGKYVRLHYDYSFTTHSIYGDAYLDPLTTYKYDTLMLFEKVNGEWKMS